MTVQLIPRECSSIERGDAEVVREPASLTPTDERALPSLQVPLPQGASSLLSATAQQVTETEPTNHSAGRGLPSLVANPLLQLVSHVEMKSRDLATIVYSFSKSLQGRIKPSLIYGARQKVAAASLLLIMIATAVIGTTAGLALGLIKARSNVTSSLKTGKQSVPPNVSLPPATIAPAPSIAPANSHDDNKSQPTTNVRAMRGIPQPSTAHLNLEAPLKDKGSKYLPRTAPPGDQKMNLHIPEVKVVEEKPVSNPPHRVIAVVVQIEEGRVKEAHIQNPQADLRAFEAMALRRARDRRYPKETKRKETVILHISNQPSP